MLPTNTNIYLNTIHVTIKQKDANLTKSLLLFKMLYYHQKYKLMHLIVLNHLFSIFFLIFCKLFVKKLKSKLFSIVFVNIVNVETVVWTFVHTFCMLYIYNVQYAVKKHLKPTLFLFVLNVSQCWTIHSVANIDTARWAHKHWLK